MNDQEFDDLEDEDFEDFIDEDDWEDSHWFTKTQEKYPGWHIVKLPNLYKMSEIEEWLPTNIKHGQYRKEGWYSNCAYSVAIVFEKPKDAIMFKLRWC